MALTQKTFGELSEGAFFVFVDEPNTVCVKSCSYGFYLIAQPADGEWELSEEEKTKNVLEGVLNFSAK